MQKRGFVFIKGGEGWLGCTRENKDLLHPGCKTPLFGFSKVDKLRKV